MPKLERSSVFCDSATGVWETRGSLHDQASRVGEALASPRQCLVFVIARVWTRR